MQHGAIHYLPTSGRVIVLADLHGEKDYLLSAMKKMQFDARDDTLILLGDAVDSIRNTDDKGLVRMLLDMKMRNPEHIVYLMGNHEWENMIRYQVDVDHDSRFGFWQKMDEGLLHTFQRLPYVAKSSHGFLFMHHGPLQDLTLKQLEQHVETGKVENSLAARLFYDAQENNAQQMLENCDAKYLITGHLFARGLEQISSCWGRLGTIHSSKPSALLIDLEKDYPRLDDVQVLSLL